MRRPSVGEHRSRTGAMFRSYFDASMAFSYERSIRIGRRRRRAEHPAFHPSLGMPVFVV